jgi:energy-coupling factor transporter ATP-binding protein EcfA2
MLQLQAISKSLVAGSGDCRATVRVLDGVCLTVSPGQIVVLSGSTASGKSTLLLCMAGVVHADSGVRRLLDPERNLIRYWPAPHDWRRPALRDRAGPPTLHLFDDPAASEFAGARAEFAAMLRRLSTQRHAVVIATAAPLRQFAAMVPRGTRYYHLERGRLVASLLPPGRAMAMVAERRVPAFG